MKQSLKAFGFFPFITRLGLYVLAMLLPLIHPAVTVPYDWSGWWMWFFLVPGEMFIAYFLVPPRVTWRLTLLFAGSLLVLSVIAAGISGPPLLVLAAGIAAFVLTLAIFRSGSFGRFLAVAEQFFLAYVYYKILNFSRASEETARAGSGITQILLFLTVVSFMVHAFALYMAAFRGGERGKTVGADRRRNRREAIIFGGLIPLFLLLSLVLPPDFVRHSVVFNTPDEDLIRDIPYDSEGFPLDRGGRGTEEGPEGRDGESGKLKGIPSDQWGSRMGEDGEEEQNQYAVMLLMSRHDPVYAADGYYGRFDSRRGFVISADEPLNELPYIRLLDTWRDENPPLDAARAPFEVRAISTLSEKALAYRPEAVEPTVLKRQYHPFSYQYDSISRISVASDRELLEVEPPTAEERRELAEYLALELDPEDEEVFRGFLEEVLEGDEGYYETVHGILSGFERYQYEVGFTDDVSVDALTRFLVESRSGDCTEFSNTTAVLARMAGIPSRVVTGYLASRSLQGPAHWRGIVELRRIIEPLTEYPLEYTYLVTTAHRHSWTQVYVPGYGWIDVEATSTAIPPPPGMDPNSRDVVIPIIEDISRSEEDFSFPWALMLRLLGGLLALGVAGTYGFRFGREGLLLLRSRENSPRGLDALYRLALMKWAASGEQVKRRHETVLEYAETMEVPEETGGDTPAREAPRTEPNARTERVGGSDAADGWRLFAEAYTQLRYRTRLPVAARYELWADVREGYRRILASRRRGILRRIGRFFNLKGLYY
jgi:hypothetical protein